MKFVFTLTPAESRRLIAKAVVAMEEVKKARESAYVIVLSGVTNALVAQELLGRRDIKPQHSTVGTSTQGVLCITNPQERDAVMPLILYKGQVVKKTPAEALQDFHRETVVIKGANAIDPEGNVGVITAGFDGGSVAQVIGYVTSKGLKFITAVGLEKLVPSVKQAAQAVGASTIDYSLGADFGMYCLSNVDAVTEIRALKLLCGVDTVHVASGGIGGNEGAVVLASVGSEGSVKKAISLVESIKGEPALPALKGTCENCRYAYCVFYQKKEEELPHWLQKKED